MDLGVLSLDNPKKLKSVADVGQRRPQTSSRSARARRGLNAAVLGGLSEDQLLQANALWERYFDSASVGDEIEPLGCAVVAERGRRALEGTVVKATKHTLHVWCAGKSKKLLRSEWRVRAATRKCEFGVV